MVERERIEAERREQILALPRFTLMRLGWRTPSGVVQGGIFYRAGDGLGPTSSDRTAREVLRDEVQRSWMSHDDQEWAIEILARPRAAITDTRSYEERLEAAAYILRYVGDGDDAEFEADSFAYNARRALAAAGLPELLAR
jgi:hypothetical protein